MFELYKTKIIKITISQYYTISCILFSFIIIKSEMYIVINNVFFNTLPIYNHSMLRVLYVFVSGV